MAELCGKHDLVVFTDEIYEHFVYDGREHVCPATLPGLRERSITISGLSKTFSITGWRIGYCLAPAEIAEAIGNFSDLVYVCAPTPLQIGAAAGLVQLDDGYFEELAAKYEAKRDRLCATLDEVGLQPWVPQGAYYVLTDTSVLPGANSQARAMHLLRATGVATVPGQSFFTGGDGDAVARFCFAKEDEVIEDACRRLETLLR